MRGFIEHLTLRSLQKNDMEGTFELLLCVSKHNLYFLPGTILSERQYFPTLRMRVANLIGRDDVIFCPSTANLEVFGSDKKAICVLQCSSI